MQLVDDVARALADRKITIEHFEGDACKDKKIRNLMSRIHAAIERFEQVQDVREVTSLAVPHQKIAARTALAARA